MRFEKIKYANKEIEIIGENIAFDWRPSQLIFGKFEINYFKANKFTIVIPSSARDLHLRRSLAPLGMTIMLNHILLNLRPSNKEHLAIGDIETIHIAQNQQSILEFKHSSFKAIGVPNQYHIVGNSQLVVKNMPPALLQIKGNGNQQEIQFTHIHLKTASGLFSGTGFLKWHPTFDWKFNILTKNLELQELNRKFTFFQTMLKDISEPSGKLNANLTWQKGIAKPSISGFAEIKNASFRIPKLNTTIENIYLKIKENQTGQLNIEGVAYANGRLTMKGHFNPRDSSLTLKLTGNQIKLINSEDYRILVSSSNLTLTGKNNQLHLEGDIFIPSAKINPSNYSKGSIVLSDDVVIISENKENESLPTSFTAKLRLIAGDDVNLDVKGLTGKLTGSLLLHYAPDKPLTATGQLTIMDGKYSIYGQTLNVTKGKLLYAGTPLDNPIIDMQAIRTLTISRDLTNQSPFGSFSIPTNVAQGNQINVGINVIGTLKQPKITLFSQPAIYNQSDILSLILFGKPADQLTNDNGRTLLQAATNLNLGGSNVGQITEQIQNTFGLDELGIQSISVPYTIKPTQTTSLVLGKNIGRRLFVSYSIGILDPINIITVSYFINNNWSLQTQTSTINNGIDLFYSIEH